uniref:Secreted protein n=1 Tax=Macrostomum lignano TaxID=282301 RepID=A0A1I8GBZ2_9PLAT
MWPSAAASTATTVSWRSWWDSDSSTSPPAPTRIPTEWPTSPAFRTPSLRWRRTSVYRATRSSSYRRSAPPETGRCSTSCCCRHRRLCASRSPVCCLPT